MNKNSIFYLCGLVVILLGAFLVVNTFRNSHQVSGQDKDVNSPAIQDTPKDKIDDILDGMTIEEKIGQMIIITFVNTDMTDKLKTFYNNVKPGGIILMGDNYSTFDRTKKLVSDLKSLSNIPLIVSTDQEGGRVQRLQKLKDDGFTFVPDMYSLGKTNDERLAYEVGKYMALEMRTLGINVVHAPVVDIWSNPKNTVIGNRSFGNDADTVKKMSLSLAKGLEDNGVIPTFKHFPGHGDTLTDSHDNLPIVNKTYDELQKLELIPFESAVDSGAKLIMTAHIALPEVTGDNTPASLSKKILTDILKDDLGYDGLIITDALNMGALAENYSEEDIYVKSIEAGADILLMPKNPQDAIDIIKNNVSEDRINESVRKILEFKYKYLNNYEYTDKSILGSEEFKKIIDKINFEK